MSVTVCEMPAPSEPIATDGPQGSLILGLMPPKILKNLFDFFHVEQNNT